MSRPCADPELVLMVADGGAACGSNTDSGLE